jgi:hypothetical protein
VFIKKENLGMLTKEMTAASFNTHTEHTKTLCGQNAWLCFNKGSTCTHHEVLKNYAEHAVAFKTKSVMICFKTLTREVTKDVQ